MIMRKLVNDNTNFYDFHVIASRLRLNLIRAMIGQIVYA